MTDAVLVALLAAVPPTIAALAAMRVAMRNLRKSDEIHILVNGNLQATKEALTQSSESLIAAQEEIRALKVELTIASGRRKRTR